MSVALVAVWAAALASPGPDLLVVLRAAARDQRGATIAAIGVITGITVWIVAALLGVTAVLSTNVAVKLSLQFIGGAFLLYLGIRGLLAAVRARRSSPPTGTADAGAASPTNLRATFAAGLITNIANPKALVFFGALFVQFAPASGQYLTTVAIMIAMAAMWFLGIARLASNPTVAARVLRSTAIVDAIAAVIFTVLGAAMLIEVAVAAIGG